MRNKFSVKSLLGPLTKIKCSKFSVKSEKLNIKETIFSTENSEKYSTKCTDKVSAENMFF